MVDVTNNLVFNLLYAHSRPWDAVAHCERILRENMRL